jgi:Iron-containing redox enzyme
VDGPSARLTRKLDLVLPAYDAPGHMLLEDPRAAELYPAYLAAASYVALSMVPLMEAALERCRALARYDPVAAQLAGYLERHIPEEMHGDEPGGELLEDLAALGVDTDALRRGPLPPPVAAMIGTLLFRIRHAHPVAVLGFLWLERYPPDAGAVERLMERTGLPSEGFRQMLLHSEVDVRHGAELAAVLDALPLEPFHEQLVGLSALETMAFMADAWLDVVTGARPADARAAAVPR